MLAIVVVSGEFAFSTSLESQSSCSKFLRRYLKQYEQAASALPEYIGQTDLSGPALIDLFSVNPKIYRLFNSDAGVNGELTIREHSLRVLKIFDTNLERGELKATRVSDGVRVASVMRAALALHDIGKPLAILAGDKALQHQFTIPILQREMRRVGFNQKEIALAKALVEGEVIGQLLQKMISIEQAEFVLKQYAARVEMSPDDFFSLKAAFYIADAGSYHTLRDKVFQEINGTLVPRDPIFSQLKARMKI